MMGYRFVSMKENGPTGPDPIQTIKIVEWGLDICNV